jgi:8-oxo-dGTP pyrophosphatase MutT (NUDIX family)
MTHKNMDSVLLTHHRKLGGWFQLGGHADGDNNPIRVALKEATEESGIPYIRVLYPEIFDLDIHTILARGTEPAHDHFDLRFALQTADSDDVIIGSESNDLRWVKIEDLHMFSNSESLLRMRDKWRHLKPSL